MVVDKVSVGAVLFRILRFYSVSIISPANRVPSFITNAVSPYQMKASSKKTLKNKLGLISQSTIKGKKLVRLAQLSLLCMVNLVGYKFRPYMRVIFRPLQGIESLNCFAC